jgi:hypothetical protein
MTRSWSTWLQEAVSSWLAAVRTIEAGARWTLAEEPRKVAAAGSTRVQVSGLLEELRREAPLRTAG